MATIQPTKGTTPKSVISNKPSSLLHLAPKKVASTKPGRVRLPPKHSVSEVAATPHRLAPKQAKRIASPNAQAKKNGSRPLRKNAPKLSKRLKKLLTGDSPLDLHEYAPTNARARALLSALETLRARTKSRLLLKQGKNLVSKKRALLARSRNISTLQVHERSARFLRTFIRKQANSPQPTKKRDQRSHRQWKITRRWSGAKFFSRACRFKKRYVHSETKTGRYGQEYTVRGGMRSFYKRPISYRCSLSPRAKLSYLPPEVSRGTLNSMLRPIFRAKLYSSIRGESSKHSRSQKMFYRQQGALPVRNGLLTTVVQGLRAKRALVPRAVKAKVNKKLVATRARLFSKQCRARRRVIRDRFRTACNKLETWGRRFFGRRHWFKKKLWIKNTSKAEGLTRLGRVSSPAARGSRRRIPTEASTRDGVVLFLRLMDQRKHLASRRIRMQAKKVKAFAFAQVRGLAPKATYRTKSPVTAPAVSRRQTRLRSLQLTDLRLRRFRKLSALAITNREGNTSHHALAALTKKYPLFSRAVSRRYIPRKLKHSPSKQLRTLGRIKHFSRARFLQRVRLSKHRLLCCRTLKQQRQLARVLLQARFPRPRNSLRNIRQSQKRARSRQFPFAARLFKARLKALSIFSNTPRPARVSKRQHLRFHLSQARTVGGNRGFVIDKQQTSKTATSAYAVVPTDASLRTLLKTTRAVARKRRRVYLFASRDARRLRRRLEQLSEAKAPLKVFANRIASGNSPRYKGRSKQRRRKFFTRDIPGLLLFTARETMKQSSPKEIWKEFSRRMNVFLAALAISPWEQARARKAAEFRRTNRLPIAPTPNMPKTSNLSKGPNMSKPKTPNMPKNPSTSKSSNVSQASNTNQKPTKHSKVNTTNPKTNHTKNGQK